MIIDLAKLRADAIAKAVGSPRGTFRVSPVENGNVAIECMDGDVVLWRRDIVLSEARALREQILQACVQAHRALERWHGIVQLAWCKTDGTQVRADIVHNHVRGRVVERSDLDSVRVVIEPEPGTREPREGWPKDGWYRFDGWPHFHEPYRRDWRIVGGLSEREACDHAR